MLWLDYCTRTPTVKKSRTQNTRGYTTPRLLLVAAEEWWVNINPHTPTPEQPAHQ